MTPTEKSPDVATLVEQLLPHLTPGIAQRIAGLPADDIETLGEAYIDLMSLDTAVPEDLRSAVEARLRATENPSPEGGEVPSVVTY